MTTSKKVTIETPVEGWSGNFAGLRFEQGKAEADSVEHAAAISYCQGRGYKVNGKAADVEDGAEQVDSRDIAGTESVGSPLRDAAVDPLPVDHLAPVNAGEADPHGPDVYSLTLGEIDPGPVQGDADEVGSARTRTRSARRS